MEGKSLRIITEMRGVALRPRGDGSNRCGFRSNDSGVGESRISVRDLIGIDRDWI